MRIPQFSALVLAALVVGIEHTNAGISSGHYRGTQSWAYLDRFCFEKGVGQLRSEFLFPKNTTPTLMAFFMEHGGKDEFSNWVNIYDGNKNCTEKYQIAKETSGTVFHLADPKYFVREEVVDEVPMILAKVSAPVLTSRSRWFFFAVGNCHDTCTSRYCEGGVDVFWSFNFTNGDSSQFYFGADENTVFATSVSFFVFYIILILYTIYVRSILKGLRKYHVTVKLLVFSIWLTGARVFFEMVFYAEYKNNGTTENTWKALSFTSGAMAEFCLVLMVMLIMKGWTIVRRKISANGRTKVAVFFVIYMAVYLTCFVYYRYGVDTAFVVYMYDTAWGYVLIFLRLCLFIWVVRAKLVTLKKYDAKRGFYTKFTIFISCWILSLPLLVVLNFTISEYMRSKLLYALEFTLLFITQLTLLDLYNPNSLVFGSSFPFHATTTTMLQGKASNKGQLMNSFADAHLRQATEISRKIRSGITVLQSFSSDMSTFLSEIDPREDVLLDRDEDLPAQLSSAVQPKSKDKSKDMSSIGMVRGRIKGRRQRNVDPRPMAALDSAPASKPKESSGSDLA